MSSMNDGDVVSNLENEDAIVAAHTEMCRSFADMLVFIAEHDRREAYTVDGARTMSDWLAYRFGYSDRYARDLVATAKAIEFLPAIADSLRAGLSTPEKARWLASFATIDEDAKLANDAIGMSGAEVRRMALERLRVTREMADARFRRRYVRIRRDVEDGLVRGSFCLSDTEGEVVLKAIERKVKQAQTVASLEARRADALVEICSLALGSDADADRATVVAHVDAALTNGTLEGGTPIATETVRRVACDARLQTVVEGTEPAPAKRTVPAHLYRRLRERDQSCTFPGCSNEVWVQAHHVRHFADGGPTTLENLVLLCGTHHRLVHEGGWQLRDDLVFVRPDGRPLQRSSVLRE